MVVPSGTGLIVNVWYVCQASMLTPAANGFSSIRDLHERKGSIRVMVHHQTSCSVFAELEIMYGDLQPDGETGRRS